jgi:hypothetical protein
MSAVGPKRKSGMSTISPVCPRVWTAPRWQELFSRLQHWSVRPCVRPLDAVHTTASHNALRGSGPDRKPAFDNAWGQLGCPDRRIDRLCITCCSSSQPSSPALFDDLVGERAADLMRRRRAFPMRRLRAEMLDNSDCPTNSCAIVPGSVKPKLTRHIRALQALTYIAPPPISLSQADTSARRDE